MHGYVCMAMYALPCMPCYASMAMHMRVCMTADTSTSIFAVETDLMFLLPLMY